MFRLVRGEDGKYRLVDEDRRVSFQVLGMMTQSVACAAVLRWDGREIPLEFDSVPRVDPVTGKKYWLYQFNHFGSSWEVQRRSGVGAYPFRDAQEEAQARLLAAEAVLVDNFQFVKGDWGVDSARVEAEGREWRASDFGYRTSSDVPGPRYPFRGAK